MAPGKFGLFKSRSREQSEQPSTENLLNTSNSSDYVAVEDSPVPSTSRGLDDYSPADICVLSLNDDDDISSINTVSRRGSQCSKEEQVDYNQLDNLSEETSTLTLDYENVDAAVGIDDDASTSYDANSIQFDETSIATSETSSVYCAMMKKTKKGRKEQFTLKDLDMWQASNVEVMQNLLSRSGTLDDQIKWEAIATSRGLCTLTNSCSCNDCLGAKYLVGVTEGDGGLGAAPLFGAINFGCQIQ